MISDTGSKPAKMIKSFRKKHKKPELKGAYVEECVYVGENLVDQLIAVKSRQELIADVVALLQSPMNNVMASLQSGKHTLAGIVKTLSEK